MNKGFLIVVFTLIVFPGLLFAGGQQEDKVREAKVLIDQKQYNEAMTILVEVMRTNPERLAEATELTTLIIEKKQEYNRKSAELIEALYVEQDVAKALILIEDLRQADPNPSDSVKNSLEVAKKAAGSVANLNFFNEVMDRAFALLEEKDYDAAVKTYLDGYEGSAAIDLHKSDFLATDMGNIIKNTVNDGIAGIKENTAGFLESFEPTMADISQFLDSVKAGSPKEELVESILTGFLGFSEFSQIIDGQSGVLDLQLQELKKKVLNESESVSTAVFYINFANQFVIGRAAKRNQEGIAYGISRVIEENLEELLTALDERGDQEYENGVAGFLNKEYTASSDFMKEAARYYYGALQFAYFADKNDRIDPLYDISARGNWIIDTSFSRFLPAQEKSKSVLAYIELIQLLREIEQVNQEETDATEGYLKAEAARISGEIKMIIDDWEMYVSLREASGIPLGTETRAGAIISLSESGTEAILEKYYAELAGKYENFILAIDQEADLFKNGITKTLTDEEGNTVEIAQFFPFLRQENFKVIRQGVELLKGDISEIHSTGENRLSDDFSGAGQVALKIGELAEKVDQALTSIDGYEKAINLAVREAAKFKDEGDLRFAQATNAFNRNQYVSAKNRIKDAGNAYDKSLKKSENAEVRRIREVSLQALSKEITDAENLLVIQEVRNMIRQGKSFYNRGLYNEAEISFLRARTRWSDTQTENNTEIEDWLIYVKSALSIKTDREIPETHPLFKVMVPLYNHAKDNYLKGVELIKQGAREAAIQLFEDAESKLQDITISFPYNKDARVLYLLIAKEKDYNAFLQDFQNKILEAKQMVTEGSRAKLNEGYSLLKDLEVIDSANRELKNAIYNAEIKLGLIRKPPDPRAKIRSKALTEEARPIVENNQTVLFNAALQKLNEAITLDSDNEQAKDLKDRIYLASGGSTQLVMDRGDMEKYEKALELYRQGQYYPANKIVQELLRKTSNKQFRKILDLEAKIKVNL